MKNRIAWVVVAGFALALGAGCTAVLPPDVQTPASPVASPGEPAGALSFQADVVPILKQHCASCHGPSGPGSFAMFDAQGAAQYEVIRVRMPDMLSAIKEGRMPPRRPGSVSEEQIDKLEAWHQGGAPEN